MGKTLFHVKGIRLNSTRKERLNTIYGVDKRLELQIVPEAPLLQVSFSLKIKLKLMNHFLIRLNFLQCLPPCFVVKFNPV